MNVSRQSISKWELGESYLDIHNIIMISDIFHVSIDYLLKDYEYQSQKMHKQSSIFLVVGTLIVLLGAMVGLMLWRYDDSSLSLLCGLSIQIVGCILFEHFVLQENNDKDEKTFFSINIWLLSWLPIKYFSEYTITYNYMRSFLLENNIVGIDFMTYFPFVLLLLLSFILFLLIKKFF